MSSAGADNNLFLPVCVCLSLVMVVMMLLLLLLLLLLLMVLPLPPLPISWSGSSAMSIRARLSKAGVRYAKFGVFRSVWFVNQWLLRLLQWLLTEVCAVWLCLPCVGGSALWSWW